MSPLELLTQTIAEGRESQRVEFKQSAPWAELKNKLIRTALAMANVRDGGIIVIGMAQNGEEFAPDGMSPADLATYKSDEIKAAINSCAEPPVSVEWFTEVLAGKTFGMLVVQEFDQFPVLCKRDDKGLDNGAIYFRSFRMPETAKVSSHFEMRDILDRAIDRGVAALVQRLNRVGLKLGENEESDAAKFARQQERL
ncbi:MAG: ATP-binding protein [Bryobacteraceae bacterium]|nr:ATP-binding protein [Bryobacteraceae bacterium]